MFIDEMNLRLKAGRGGDGVVRWLHEKGKEFGGPSGGNGGKGGDVYALATRDIGVLAAYRNSKIFEAGRGHDGSGNTKQGGAGEDAEIKLPVGSRLTNLASGHVIELLNDGEKILLLKGGRGGLGNEHFKGSTNVRPKESTEGVDGDEADFFVEVLLIADAGLVGLPNAGKSSLLNALTSARSKIGNFPFTTLEPALGSLHGVVLADIPGLIEGAAEGKGLGHKFLRHIERTKSIIHCVSSESDDPLKDYKIIRNELKLYGEELIKKPEIVILTKVDMISESEKEDKLGLLRAASLEVWPASILDNVSIKSLSDHLSRKLTIAS